MQSSKEEQGEIKAFLSDRCKEVEENNRGKNQRSLQENQRYQGNITYGSGTTTSGSVKIIKDLDINLAGYDLLIVEDILDSGVTLSNLKEILLTRGPASVKICTLLDKPERRKADVVADYIGTTIPDAFVVGYGLDYDEKYRNLPYVGILSPSVYAE